MCWNTAYTPNTKYSIEFSFDLLVINKYIFHFTDNVDVRLVGSPVSMPGPYNPFVGRVEVRDPNTGTWGTICDDEWHWEDAAVICR